MPFRQVFRIAQQQPATAFDDLPGLRVITQLVCLVYPYAVNDLTSELCNHMEQVIDHLCLRTVFPHFQIERSIHVHGNRLDGSTSLWPQPAKEGPEGGSAASFSHPQYLLCIRIRHDSGITVSLKQGELIHHQAAQGMPLWLTNLPQHSPVIDAFNGMPVQPGQAGHVLNRK
ncbi:hypothetical protein D3C75_717220 [compost metagenome]